MPNEYWDEVTGEDLEQGDLLLGVSVPVPDEVIPDEPSQISFTVHVADLVVITQTCDLVNSPTPESVALVPATTVEEFSEVNSKYENRKHFNEIIKGRIQGLYFLPSPTDPSDPEQGRIVDFAEIYSVPFRNVSEFANNAGARHRFLSPYREHLSQAFGSYYMRVALPFSIQRF